MRKYILNLKLEDLKEMVNHVPFSIGNIEDLVMANSKAYKLTFYDGKFCFSSKRLKKADSFYLPYYKFIFTIISSKPNSVDILGKAELDWFKFFPFFSVLLIAMYASFFVFIRYNSLVLFPIGFFIPIYHLIRLILLNIKSLEADFLELLSANTKN
jgi:hypothetical protein